MSRYLIQFYLTTADLTRKKQAKDLADKIVNCELPKKLEERIETFSYADELNNRESLITKID